MSTSNWVEREIERLENESAFCNKVFISNKTDLYEDLTGNMYDRIVYLYKMPCDKYCEELDVMFNADVSNISYMGNEENGYILLSSEYSNNRTFGAELYIKGDLSAIKFVFSDLWSCYYFIKMQNSEETIVLHCLQ